MTGFVFGEATLILSYIIFLHFTTDLTGDGLG